jgi:serine/threonine protein kinase
MFALGCVMAELYNLYPLFPGKTELDQINMITKVLGCPTQQTWKEGLDLAERIPVKFARQTPVPLSSEIPTASTTSLLLLSQLLLLNPKQRITATNALAHEFFVVGDGPELTASSAEHRVVSVSPNMKNNASQLGSQSFVKAGSKRLQHAGFFAGVIVADDSPATIVNPYRTNRHIKARVEAK